MTAAAVILLLIGTGQGVLLWVACRVIAGACRATDRLTAERDAARRLNIALGDRCAAQAFLLSRRSEGGRT